jgi:hypothetical protein
LCHQIAVHTNQLHRQSIYDKFFLNFNSIFDDSVTCFFRQFVYDVVGIKQTSKVTMQTFITADEFVAKSEAWHQSTLFQPENATERTAEENTLYSGESNNLSANEPFLIQRNAHSAFFRTQSRVSMALNR